MPSPLHPSPSVKTDRLIVRRFAETDLDDFLAYHNHPDISTYVPMESMSEAQASTFLARQAVAVDNQKNLYHAFAIHHTGDDKVIGEVGIYLGPAPEYKAEIGFALHPEYQGRGYATEAARPLLEYAFVTCDLHRVTAMCDTRNAPSFKLMERLAMRREGHLLQSHLTGEVWQDEYLYALLRDEWAAQTGQAVN